MRCPLCHGQIEPPSRQVPIERDVGIVNCRRCGEYCITRTALISQRTNHWESYQVAYISHVIRSRADRGELPDINSFELEHWAETATRATIQEQHDRLILWLGHRPRKSGERDRYYV